MSPNQTPMPFQSPTLQAARETRRMSFTMNRILDVGASIVIVVLATVTGGATAFLGV